MKIHNASKQIQIVVTFEILFTVSIYVGFFIVRQTMSPEYLFIENPAFTEKHTICGLAVIVSMVNA